MSHTFLEQLWIARYVIMNGIGVTVSISLLAILAGSVLGVFVGLALVYGGIVLRLAVRAYTDIIRGTPVLVLVLASYYVSAAVGLDLGPFSAGVLALAIFCSSHAEPGRDRPQLRRRGAASGRRDSLLHQRNAARSRCHRLGSNGRGIMAARAPPSRCRAFPRPRRWSPPDWWSPASRRRGSGSPRR